MIYERFSDGYKLNVTICTKIEQGQPANYNEDNAIDVLTMFN